MSMYKGIRLKTQTERLGIFVTSADAHRIADELVKRFNAPSNGLYVDGRRHIGTECSKIYKALFPVMLHQEELCYLEFNENTRQFFNKNDMYYNPKKLLTKSNSSTKYVQLISLNILGIYLGKLRLSDAIIDNVLEKIRSTVVTLETDNANIVSGNKPVKIQGKPLVKILAEKEVNKEIDNEGDLLKDIGIGLKLVLDKECALSYVKTGSLMRKDIYVTLKTIAAHEGKPMYQVLEDIILRNGSYDMSILGGGN